MDRDNFIFKLPASMVAASASSFGSIHSQERDPRLMVITADSFDSNTDAVNRWYASLNGTKIRGIEVRKERDTFRHEFVLIYVTDGNTYRFERRPDMNKIKTIGHMVDGCKSEDTIIPVTYNENSQLQQNTDQVEQVLFEDPKPDVAAAIFMGVYLLCNRRTRKYSMVDHNCYFFARCISNFVAGGNARAKLGRSVDLDFCEQVAKFTLKGMKKDETNYFQFDADQQIRLNF
jgi:hypothetical protein